MIRLAVRCREQDAERVLAELLELAPGGVEEEHGDGWVEYAVYGPPGELPALPELEAEAGKGSVQITSTEIPDDWADRWRDFHEPVIVADGRLVVRPSWTKENAPAAQVDIVIDPGQAFGTGAHATTRMCLELLLELADESPSRGPLVDLGTGSGVLAIAAAKLGWSPVLGLDHELAALEAAEANARANGVELELRRVNLRTETAPAEETVIANLTGPLLRDVISSLAPPLPATFLCSGMLAGESDAVSGDFRAAGFTETRRARDGDWVAICFARP